jgi:hypothetical protein
MIVACDWSSSRACQSRYRQRGSAMLEVQIAFALLGIGLAGLCPFVVVQLRQLSKLESRLKASSYTYNSVGMASRTVLSNQTYYLVPWNNPWTRKLSTRAQVLTTASNPGDPAVTIPPTTHVTLTQPVSLTRDSDGNVIGVTCVVVVN